MSKAETCLNTNDPAYLRFARSKAMHLAIHTSGHWHELKKSSMTLTDNATKHVRSNVRVSEIKCLQCHTKATAIRYNMHHGVFILE